MDSAETVKQEDPSQFHDSLLGCWWLDTTLGIVTTSTPNWAESDTHGDAADVPTMLEITHDSIYSYEVGADGCYWRDTMACALVDSGLLHSGFVKGEGEYYGEPVQVGMGLAFEGGTLVLTSSFWFTDQDTTKTVAISAYLYSCDCADPPSDVWVRCDN
jgi:hypothetical protein